MLHGNSCATLTSGTAALNLVFIRILPIVVISAVYALAANQRFTRYDDPSRVTDNSRVSAGFTANPRYLLVSYFLCSPLVKAGAHDLSLIVRQEAAAGARRD